MTGSERTIGEQPELVSLIEGEPLLMSGRLVLRRLEQADSDALRELTDDPLVYRYLPTFLYEKQDPDLSHVLDGLYGECLRESVILGIFCEGTFAGLMELYGYRPELRKISVGYRLLTRFWGKGIATEALQLAVRYLYEEAGIEIITASTMVENRASANVLRKNGFTLVVSGVGEDWGYEEPTISDKWIR